MTGRVVGIAALALVVAWAAFARETPQEAVPVMIGEIPDFDACHGWDEVVGLRHSKLAVRAGPGLHFARVDALDNGQGVYGCDTSAKGDWIGIVYMPGEDGPDCGVTSPVPEHRAYAGPSRSGWVHTRWIRVIAG